MGKKRKSLSTSLDEVDRSMYSTFCSTANSLSQLYTQSMNQQKLSFQAGERHALEKIYQWMVRQQEGGSRVTSADILSYVQSELDYYGEEPSMSPRPPVTNSGGSSEPPRNNVFSNALSSPVRRSLQNYHISQGNNETNFIQNQNQNQNQSQNRDSNPSNSNDSTMDMHAD